MNKFKIPIYLLTLLLVIVLLLAGGCTSSEEKETDTDQENTFGIYLLAENIPAEQITSVDLNTLKLQDKPLLSVDDIITYNKDTHEIRLTDNKAEEFASFRPPMSGTSFIVCVGSERVYSGALWSSISSMSFGIVIEPMYAGINNSIQIQLGYQSERFYDGADPRSDPRILASLGQAGKLV